MALKWFDASDAEKFGQSLAQFFIKKVPTTIEKGKHINMAEQIKVIEQLYLQIDQFKLNNSLNILKKAKLGRAFKYELMAAGYKPEFVDQVTKGVLLKL